MKFVFRCEICLILSRKIVFCYAVIFKFPYCYSYFSQAVALQSVSATNRIHLD